MLKRIIVGGAAVLAVGGTIWGVSGQDHTKRDSAGSVVTAGQLGVFVTHLGDCFQSLPGSNTGVSTVEAVPCTSPHHWQDVYKGTLTDSTFNHSAQVTEVQNLCVQKITALSQTWSATITTEYVGALGTDMTPSEESWTKGDRSLDCLLGSPSLSFSVSALSSR